MTEDLRTWLYPLGLISTIGFTLRFVIQWIESERAGKSVVHASFWWWSILGNATLALHSFIQGQFPICAIQSLNGVIAGRNLNLMKTPSAQWKLRTVLIALVLALAIPTAAFWFFAPNDWLRIPSHSFQTNGPEINFGWHLLGMTGVFLFALRFWVQWVQAEMNHKSTLERPFWWLSLIGAFFSIIYFAMIRDYVNLVGPLFGIFPYLRNLLLLQKPQKEGVRNG